jgi:putative transcriptional regulator
MSIHMIEPGLLLAAPRMGDPNFEGTVVLLGAHEEGGSIGWTVNGQNLADAREIVRATGLVAATDALPAVFEREALSGGPVSPESVWILYRREKDVDALPGSILIGDEIAVTSSIEACTSTSSSAKASRYDVGMDALNSSNDSTRAISRA